QNYMAYQLELFARHSEADPQVPAWMVFDARFRRSYFVGPLSTERFRPDWMLPRSYFSSGFLSKAGTIRELADMAGIDRYYADPGIKPNPCLAPITEPPFYAIRIDPGDFGTHGGLQTDTNARVLGAGGEPI